MRKLIALTLAGVIALAPMSAFAEEDLEARITALEERVAALEAQIGSIPDEVSSTAEQEAEAVETGMISNGCTLEYKKCEVTTGYWGDPCVVLFFEFTNNSGDTTSAQLEYLIKVFQHDAQVDFTSVKDTPEFLNNLKELRSGAEPIDVAWAFKIDDESDIIVDIVSMSDTVDDVEFTVSLK